MAEVCLLGRRKLTEHRLSKLLCMCVRACVRACVCVCVCVEGVCGLGLCLSENISFGASWFVCLFEVRNWMNKGLSSSSFKAK